MQPCRESVNRGGVEKHRSHPSLKLYAHSKSDLVFDCERYTSLWSFINDGPPSIRIVDRKKDELIERVVVAVKKIEALTPIHMDYGINHPVKRMPYALDKKTLTRFLEGRKELDFSSIKTSELSRTAPGMDIQYIISTPYALALLHLRTNLNPKTTLSSLNDLLTLSQTYRKELDLRVQILMALSKIPQDHKEKFAKIVEKISQESLTQLCVALLA